MMRTSMAAGVLLTVGLGVTALAYVGTGYQLFGDAEFVSPGNNSNRAVKLNADTPGQSGGVSFGVSSTLTVADMSELSTDTFFPTGSTCGGGSPRFQIRVEDASIPGGSANIFVYIGPPPNYTGCPSGVWSNTGDLLTPASLVDTSQLPGGTFYDPWADAQARYAGFSVTAISVVTDTFAGPRTVIVDNTEVNGTLHDYEFDSKDDCKKGGWKNFTVDPGPFKNQGQCVSHFAKNKNKKNKKK